MATSFNEDENKICFDDLDSLFDQNRLLASFASFEYMCKVTDRSGTTLLHAAIRNRNKDLAICLIKHGSNVNAKEGPSGKTPIMMSIEFKQFEVTKKLLEANADVSIVDNCGKTLMSRVISESKTLPPWLVDMISKQIKLNALSQAEIESMAQELMNAGFSLHSAVLLNNSAILEIFLKNGYDVDSQECDLFYSKRPLHVAVEYLKLESVKTLVQHGADVNKGNHAGAVPLTMYVCANDSDENLEILKILLDAGTSLTARLSAGLMQMLYVLERGKRKAINLILKYDVDFFARDKHGDTALHFLVLNSNPGIMEELRGKKFNVNIVNNERKSPLHLAAEFGRIDSIRFLLENGVNVNFPDFNDGCTPLFKSLSFHAPKSQLKKCIRLLINYGADVNYVSKYEETCFDIVSQNQTPDLIRPVLAHLAALYIRSAKNIPKLTRQQILSRDYFKKYFRYYFQQLKQIELLGSDLSSLIFKLFTDHEENVTRFARNKQSTLQLLQVINERPYKSYYLLKLKRRLIKALRIVKLRKQASSYLINVIGFNLVPTITDKIFICLSQDDLKNFINIFDSAA